MRARTSSVLSLSLASLSLSFSLVACNISPGEPNEPVEVIRATTELSSTTLRTGQAMTIRVKATNTSSTPVTINANDCPFRFVVLQGNQEVAPGPVTCDMSLRQKTLAPGESHEAVYQWAGDRRKDDPTMSSTIPLPNGSYTLRGFVAGTKGLVVTDPVTITIER